MTGKRLGFLALGLVLLTFWFIGRSQPADAIREKVDIRLAPKVESPHLVKLASVAEVTPAIVPSAKVESNVAHTLQSFKDFSDRLRQIDACAESECDYPQTDPHSYEFAMGQDLKRTLFQLSDFVRGQGLRSDEVSEEARKYLASSDGHVQEAALDLLSTQPTSRENLEAVLNDILQGPDSDLVDHALLELQRYTALNDLEKINDGLAQALLTGTPFVAREVSTKLLPFLNEKNLPFFEDVVSKLPEQSTSRMNLENLLSEFQKHLNDG